MRERPAGCDEQGIERFQGVTKVKVAKAKRWEARIVVTDDGKPKRTSTSPRLHLHKNIPHAASCLGRAAALADRHKGREGSGSQGLTRH